LFLLSELQEYMIFSARECAARCDRVALHTFQPI